MLRNLKRIPKTAQTHPKGTPESIQDQRCDQRKTQEVSRRRPKTHTAPKRPTKPQKYQIPFDNFAFFLTPNSLSKTKDLLIKTPHGDPPSGAYKFALAAPKCCYLMQIGYIGPPRKPTRKKKQKIEKRF